MAQVVAEVDPSEPKDVIALGHDTKAARDERMRVVKETMQAASTSSGYGDYHWDRVSTGSNPSLREGEC